MGYGITRFTGHVDPELVCSICTGVLEDAVELSNCEHAFCNRCIREFIHNNGWICPIDQVKIQGEDHIGPIPRLLRNLLGRLDIACDYAAYGCRMIAKLEHLQAHVTRCDSNPELCEPCERGCGILIHRSATAEHNCVATLRDSVKNQQIEMNTMMMVLNVQRVELRAQRQEMASLKAMVRAWHARDVAANNTFNSVMRMQLGIWGDTLSKARVTEWQTLETVPPVLVQRMIRRTLSEAECPDMLLEPLVNACVEWKWPEALRSVEARRNNLHHYDVLVYRRVPGKQAVVVLPTDNEHMAPEFVLDCGYLLIFESGIENVE